MTDFTINSVAISSLGFKLKGVFGHLGLGGRKPVLGNSEDLVFNYRETQNGYFEDSPEVTVSAFGVFDSIEAAEEAWFRLLGLLIVPMQRTFAHTSGAQSVAFKGVMHKGATCRYKRNAQGRTILDVQLKLLKTDD